MSPRQAAPQVIPPRRRTPSDKEKYGCLHEPIHQGEVLCDISEKKWKLGRSIGVGAFGEIYLASDDITKNVGMDAKYVVKVEPHTNGPLFVEMNFYLRAGREEQVFEWKTSRRLKHLGVPILYGFGTHVYRGQKLRFIVLPRFGDDIHKLYLKHSKKFHIKTALTLASHVIDILEYVHYCGYVHADIKGMNLVLGDTYPAPIYLLDYGLASRFAHWDGVHKDWDPDTRRAEAGTLEFSSRDSHVGAVSRRSDLESLGYNMIRWLHGKLPWDSPHILANPELVGEMKDRAMSNVKVFLSAAFPETQPPKELVEYFSYVASLQFSSKPDYSFCKNLFSLGVRNAGFLDDLKLTFDSHAKLPKKALKRPAESENVNSIKRKKTVSYSSRKPCSVFNHTVTTTRVTTRNLDSGPKLRSKDFNWATILAGHPEKSKSVRVRETKEKERKTKASLESSPKADGVKIYFPREVREIQNPTPEMKKLMIKKLRKSSESKRFSKIDCSPSRPSYCTPAMQAVRDIIRQQTRILRSASRKEKRPVNLYKV